MYGNATILREDELKNSGPYAIVELVAQRISNAQKTAAKWLARNMYSSAADSAAEITGFLGLCNNATYGSLAAADLTDAFGGTPWTGRLTTTTEPISPAVVRTACSAAKLWDGPDGKPTIVFTTETLWNVLASILTTAQRFQPADTIRAGFTVMYFDGKLIVADDYCPSGYFFAVNEAFFGFAVHTDGYYVRTPWGDLTNAGGPVGRTMKILWDGHPICSNRKAHIGHSNLS